MLWHHCPLFPTEELRPVEVSSGQENTVLLPWVKPVLGFQVYSDLHLLHSWHHIDPCRWWKGREGGLYWVAEHMPFSVMSHPHSCPHLCPLHSIYTLPSIPCAYWGQWTCIHCWCTGLATLQTFETDKKCLIQFKHPFHKYFMSIGLDSEDLWSCCAHTYLVCSLTPCRALAAPMGLYGAAPAIYLAQNWEALNYPGSSTPYLISPLLHFPPGP